MRGRSPLTTLATLQQDLKDFTEKGNGDLNKAKEYNNVIGPPLLDIPLDMVKQPSTVSAIYFSNEI